MKKTYALAAAAAVLAGGLLYIYLSGLGRAAGENPAASGADGPAYATVVIAAADIDEGTMLKEELLEVKSLPLGDVAANAASRIDEAAGMITSTALERGEQIILTKLLRAEDYSRKLSGIGTGSGKTVSAAKLVLALVG